MNSRSKYKTKQLESLIQYLKTMSGIHITAGDVCEYFRKEGKPMGLSTVYRRLEMLVDEGMLNKYFIDGNSPACFEYIDPDSHDTEEVCYHCKCEKCGKVIHLHCDELVCFQDHLHMEHRFKLNPLRTVLYGLCEDCMV